jgi:Na+/glutamate symporter
MEYLIGLTIGLLIGYPIVHRLVSKLETCAESEEAKPSESELRQSKHPKQSNKQKAAFSVVKFPI